MSTPFPYTLYWILTFAFKVLLQNRREERGGVREDGAQGERIWADSRRHVLLKYSPVLFVSVVGASVYVLYTDGRTH